MSTWNLADALVLVRKIELIAPAAGCHVALTGGVLYKDGARKDLDLLFYRIRQVKEIDMEKLWQLLELVDVHKVAGLGWCYKAKYVTSDPEPKNIDILFPEEQAGDYDPEKHQH